MAILDANPYQFNRREIHGEETQCLTCGIVIKSKDWKSHSAGKKHRFAQQKEKNALKANGQLPSEATAAALGASSQQVAGSVTSTMPANPNITCHKCGEVGHMAKQCFAGIECGKCKQMGHMAKDCTSSNQAAGGAFACHNCDSAEHKARDCPEPRVPRCRNCDERGHVAKECPKPKDWSRVKCDNCQQMGHGRARCPNPTVEPPADDSWGGGDAAVNDNGAIGSTGSWNSGATDDPAPSAESGWANGANDVSGGWGAETTTAAGTDGW